MSETRFRVFEEKMRSEGLPDVVIRTFAHYYQQLLKGETGLLEEGAIRSVDSVPNLEDFPERLESVGRAALSRTVMVKLNGGLGTSMGLDRAKSLLIVKDGLSFLDIIARQALHSQIPLVLMNSFSTREDSLAALGGYADLSGPFDTDFMQHKVPKVVLEDFSPAHSPHAPEHEWCPPGHGDLYTALVTTGTLRKMIEAGYEYLFVSNADNLGASLDLSLLGFLVDEHLPFMMEVADRTQADRKGGHLAKTLDGQLILRESAQCAAHDVESFQDISKHRYFNTNNLWIHLPALEELMAARDDLLGLAMIRNRKTLDPRDANSPAVYQIETAMGSAISVFKNAAAVRVPRTRFAPVKTTSDLLAIRSDDCVLSSDFRILPAPARQGAAALVELDPKHYARIDDLEQRFPQGAPSLLACESLKVIGDVRFGQGVRCEGRVTIENTGEGQAVVADGTLCTGHMLLAPTT